MISRAFLRAATVAAVAAVTSIGVRAGAQTIDSPMPEFPPPPSVLTAPAAPALALPRTPGPVGFEEPISGQWVSCSWIRRRLTILNPRLVQGEPLRMRLELQSEIRPGASSEFSAKLVWGSDLLMTVRAPNDPRPFNYQPFRIGDLVNNTVYTLNSGQRARLDIEALYDENSVTGALFDAVGKFQLRVFLKCVDQAGESTDPIILDLGTFTVEVFPSSGDDRTALELLAKDPATYLGLAIGTFPKQNQLAAVDQAIRTAPRARLRPHLLFALAAHYSAPKGDRARAVKLLDQLIREYPAHPIVEDALYRAHALCLLLGDAERADRYFNHLWQDPVMTQRLPPSSQLVRTLLGSAERQPRKPNWMIMEEASWERYVPVATPTPYPTPAPEFILAD